MWCENLRSSSKDWMDKAKEISSNDLFTCTYDFVAFEMPANFASSQASIAAGKKGDILKMCVLIGMICKNLYEFTDLIIPIPVQSWKGNMEKKMMNDRVQRVFNMDRDQTCQIDNNVVDTTHELDAIGIGLYLQGKL